MMQGASSSDQFTLVDCLFLRGGGMTYCSVT